MLRSYMGGLANAIYTLHRPNSLRYWDLGPKPLVGDLQRLADALIRVYDDTANVIETTSTKANSKSRDGYAPQS